MAGEPTSLVSGRLRNFLCGTFFEGNSARTQLELLGSVGWVQILINFRTPCGPDYEKHEELSPNCRHNQIHNSRHMFFLDHRRSIPASTYHPPSYPVCS